MEEATTISQALPRETEIVFGILVEAADWLRERGIPMWRSDELAREQISADVAQGYFFIARCGGKVAGTIKFELQDPLFWPDTPTDEAAFIHRFAVRRAFAGGRVSSLLLRWAAQRAESLGRRFLRLDCEASRPRLRAVYESCGFRHHSDRQVGPYFVSRYELPLATTRSETGATKIEGAEGAIACPVCGAATVQEKCKVICKSDRCRGRVVYNCAEF